MRINLWYSEDVCKWRWTLTHSLSGVQFKQESGSQIDLRTVMNDIANTVEYIIDSKVE